MDEAQVVGENRAQRAGLVIPPAVAFGTLDSREDLGVRDRLERAEVSAQTIVQCGRRARGDLSLALC
jgi:hypothetical protein